MHRHRWAGDDLSSGEFGARLEEVAQSHHPRGCPGAEGLIRLDPAIEREWLWQSVEGNG